MMQEDRSEVVILPKVGVVNDGAPPLVIFLHGRALPASSVDSVADAFPNARIVAPIGQVPLKRGTTWFLNESVGIARPDSVASAERNFIDWLANNVDEGTRPWLCGFSNGGAFAAHMLIGHPEMFSGAVLLSAPLVLPPWPFGRLLGKSIFYCYGSRDDVVPNAILGAGSDYLLLRSGANATICTLDIKHEVSFEEVALLKEWFSSQAPQSRP